MINWFPGHMNKTLKEIRNNAKFCNVFIYVLDARAPMSCLNPKFKDIVGDKPVVYILNKSDLADNTQTQKFKKHFADQPNSQCVVLNAGISAEGKKIVAAINALLKPLIQKNLENQVNFIFRSMVIGVPNCGKSTIVNNLLGKSREKTGNKAGVTRAVKWVKINKHLEIMDTPGTLWPSFENEQTGYNLAYIGSIKDEVLPITVLAQKFISDIKFDFLQKKYNIENGTPLEILENIARKRGCILKGNETDYERAATLLLNDFRKGSLGRITLESI